MKSGLYRRGLNSQEFKIIHLCCISYLDCGLTHVWCGSYVQNHFNYDLVLKIVPMNVPFSYSNSNETIVPRFFQTAPYNELPTVSTMIMILIAMPIMIIVVFKSALYFVRETMAATDLFAY